MADVAGPLLNYSLIITGCFCLIYVFVVTYRGVVVETIAVDPLEIVEMGRRSLRRGSKFIENSQHKIASSLNRGDSYTLLSSNGGINGDDDN